MNRPSIPPARKNERGDILVLLMVILYILSMAIPLAVGIYKELEHQAREDVKACEDALAVWSARATPPFPENPPYTEEQRQLEEDIRMLEVRGLLSAKSTYSGMVDHFGRLLEKEYEPMTRQSANLERKGIDLYKNSTDAAMRAWGAKLVETAFRADLQIASRIEKDTRTLAARCGRTGYSEDELQAIRSRLHSLLKSRSLSRDELAMLLEFSHHYFETAIMVKSSEPETDAVDLIFVIDTTGSMRDDIDEAKNSSHAVIASLLNSSSSFRVAVVAYRDFDDEYVTKPYPFTSDDKVAQGYINALEVGGGGDHPEAVYTALMAALNTEGLGPWRNGVHKIIILMGDAPPHGRKNTEEEVIRRAYEVDPAHIFPITIEGADDKTRVAFIRLAQGTKGRAYSTSSAAELPGTLQRVIAESIQMVSLSTSQPPSARPPQPLPSHPPQDHGTLPVGLIISSLVVFFALLAVLLAVLLLLNMRPSRVRGNKITIGRGRNCDVILDDPFVSRHHAVLVEDDDKWIVRDLGSRHGIRVNGMPTVITRIGPNDLVGIGTAEYRVADLVRRVR